MNDDFNEMSSAFKQESDDLLVAMEESLLLMQDEGMNKEAIDAIFRAAHTIKGAGGMFEINYLVEFTHTAENLLDMIRNDEVEYSDELLELFFEVKDHMQALVDYAVDEQSDNLTEELQSRSDELLEQLRTYIEGGDTGNKVVMEQNDFEDEIAKLIALNEQKAAALPYFEYTIKLNFIPESIESGIDPLEFINAIKENANIKSIAVDTSSIPSIFELNPIDLYLSKYIIEIESQKTKEYLLTLFEVALDFCEIEIEGEEEESGEELQEEDVQEQETLKEAPKKEPQHNKKEDKKEDKKANKSVFLRVDAAKIDLLINQIGEMVIANSNVIQKATQSQNKDLIESVSVVSRMLEDVRESAMQTRMVQIGETFNRFKRIVRDLSKKLGKDIDLVMEGADTELDKTVIEKITDPMIHLVRNSLDHGIETVEARKEAGKNPKGKLTLKAFHDAGNIAIQIKDDGKGIDPEFIFNKSVEKGIVESSAHLTDKEKMMLIMAPGFSTADQVSDISGRGVGMDVVKKNIEELRGVIDIDSVLGEGTVMTIRLPLTLAIIDGFLVKVSGAFYVIPLEMIVECIEFSDYFKDNMNDNNYINLRGNMLPILDLSNYFGISQHDDAKSNIVIVQFADQKVGLVVDELHGEFQTVIKPLGKVFSNARGIGGATILGSGEVAMIIDVPVLVKGSN